MAIQGTEKEGRNRERSEGISAVPIFWKTRTIELEVARVEIVKSCRVGNIRNNPCLVERRERVDIIRKKCKNLRTIERNCCNARNNISCRDCFYRISYHLRIYGYYGNGCLAQKVLSRKLN